MTDDQFEKLAQLIQGAQEDLSERIEDLKAEMHEEFGSIRNELMYIHKRLDALEEKVGQHTGYAKEIDHILARVAVIEQKLGIPTPAAAE